VYAFEDVVRFFGVLEEYIKYFLLIARNLYHVFVILKEKKWIHTPHHFLCYLNYKQGPGIVFCVCYIHSKTMFVVLMERVWKDNSKHFKYMY